MTILAIDQGTTSTRALALRKNGTASIVHAVEHRQIYPQAGWVEHDPEELIANITSCIEAEPAADAIGIDNQGESCLAWDAETKQALSPVIVWQDGRTQQTVEQLKSDGVEPQVLETTGLPLDTYFSASKLAWIVANLPAAKAALSRGTLRMGTTDAFFLDRLTGHFVTDITTASRTSLMNLETGDWDDDMLRLFGVPRAALPRIVPTTGDFGTITAQGRHIPVTASIVDQQAALYGHGCTAPGEAKATFGTGAFVLMLTGNQAFRAPDIGLLPTVAWQRHDEAPMFALDGGVFSASSALNWVRSLGLFSTFDEIDAFAGETAAERGLAFVPALGGLGCPHWDRNARGAWFGLSLDTSARVMVQAVLEGVAFRTAEVLNAMSQKVPTTGHISIDGGMTANSYFCQFLADVLERQVLVHENSELTAIGTALLAGEAHARGHSYSPTIRMVSPKTMRADQMPWYAAAVAATRQFAQTSS